MGGKPVTVSDNPDGTFTVKNTTGSLVIKSVKTGKVRAVTVSGNAASDITAVSTAVYGTDYFFALTNDSDYMYNVSVTVGGASYTDYGKRQETYSIPGADLIGNVVITANKVLIMPITVSVLFTGSGAGNASGESTAMPNSNYSFTVNSISDFSYTVSALMGGVPAVVIDKGNGSYMIENVTDALVITVESTAQTTAEVTEYVEPDSSGSYTSGAQDVTVVVSGDCTVRFETNGGSDVADMTVRYGDKVQKPAAPTRDGYVFQGWYGNSDNTAPWNFDTDTVTENLTLYAEWKTSPATEADDVRTVEFKWWIPTILILAVLLILTVLLTLCKKKTVNLVSNGGAETGSLFVIKCRH